MKESTITNQTIDQLHQRIAALQAENQKLRRDLLANRQLLDSIYDTVNVGICITDEDARFIHVNRVYCEIYGYTVEELIGQPFTIVLPTAEAKAQGMRVYNRFLEDAFEIETEWQVIRKDGSQITIIAIAGLYIDEQGKRYKITVVQDISDRKAMEAARERLIAELNAFAHTVAHDLKNPLSVTIGFAETLLESADVMPKDTIQHYLEGIADTGYKMSQIIDALLLLASTRAAEVRIERLDMGLLIDGSLARLRPMIETHQAEITLSPPPDGWPQVVGYTPWIEEVWVNYISNALKYGSVPPQPPRIEIGAAPEADDKARFWVRDHGPGISPEDQKKLFTEFTRLEEDRAEGHGLGLSIAQSIVAKLGGSVGVASTPGQGSTFSFTLPLAE